jgi:hypothetical protein
MVVLFRLSRLYLCHLTQCALLSCVYIETVSSECVHDPLLDSQYAAAFGVVLLVWHFFAGA